MLGADAQTSPLRAQTMLVDALSDLLLGTGYCESPLVSDGPRSPDTEVFQQAVTKFTAGLEAAQAITDDADAQRKWTNVAHAGRARANLMAGNYDAAKADAQAVDPGFEYDALYSEAGGYTTTSNPGEQFNQNRNRSGGLRRLYHSRVHVIDSVTTGEAYLRDWSSGQDDHRMAVTRFEGQLGVNNRFAYYGITKYADRTSPIRMLSKIESNLIEAEVAMRAGDYATEANILNVMRARPGVALPPIPAPGGCGCGAKRPGQRAHGGALGGRQSYAGPVSVQPGDADPGTGARDEAAAVHYRDSEQLRHEGWRGYLPEPSPNRGHPACASGADRSPVRPRCVCAVT